MLHVSYTDAGHIKEEHTSTEKLSVCITVDSTLAQGLRPLSAHARQKLQESFPKSGVAGRSSTPEEFAGVVAGHLMFPLH